MVKKKGFHFCLAWITVFFLSSDILLEHCDLTRAAGLQQSAKGYIAFSSDREGSWDIYVMDTNGENVRQLTSDEEVDKQPTWSPDGQQIAFERNYDIYIMDANGENLRLLTHTGEDLKKGTYYGESSPTWSPDGKYIFYTASDIMKGTRIERMRSDGQVFDNGEWRLKICCDEASGWSPHIHSEGNRLVLVSDRLAPHHWSSQEIFIMSFASLIKDKNFRLTNNDHQDENPIFSPDGNRVAFFSRIDDIWSLQIVDADGSGSQLLIDGLADEGRPSWSPAGDYIAFSGLHRPSVTQQIFVVSTDGLRLHMLPGEGNNIDPHFMPGADEVSFSIGGDIVWDKSATTDDVSPQPIIGTEEPPNHNPEPTLSVQGCQFYQLLPRLRRGETGRASIHLYSRYLREEPEGELVGLVPSGATFEVLNGPVSKVDREGMCIIWWQVRLHGTSEVGWVAESANEYFLEPYAIPADGLVSFGAPDPKIICPGSPPARMIIGQQGRTFPNDPTSTSLRRSPAGRKIGQIDGGIVFDVMDGPECGILEGVNYTWWKIYVHSRSLIAWIPEGIGNAYWIEPLVTANEGF